MSRSRRQPRPATPRARQTEDQRREKSRERSRLYRLRKEVRERELSAELQSLERQVAEPPPAADLFAQAGPLELAPPAAPAVDEAAAAAAAEKKARLDREERIDLLSDALAVSVELGTDLIVLGALGPESPKLGTARSRLLAAAWAPLLERYLPPESTEWMPWLVAVGVTGNVAREFGSELACYAEKRRLEQARRVSPAPLGVAR